MSSNQVSLRSTARELHIEDHDKVEHDLDAFYNQSSFWKHKWDARRARHEGLSRVANSLLQMVGWSISEKRHEDPNVVIVIGLARCVDKNGPLSLDGLFQDFFMREGTYSTCSYTYFYSTLLYVNFY
jgi:hypothetical protein